MKLTQPMKNLLVSVYRLTSGAPHASTKEIAESLGVSLPTVSEKIVRLAEQGYLDHRWRKGVALTEEGRLVALSVLRRHRLIETFLVKVLGYSIDEVDEEARRLEHAVSDRLTDAIDSLLQHPDRDPHGHPIPSKEGSVAVSDHRTLAEALPGSTVVVKEVDDRERDRLHYLMELGLVPGARLAVLEVAPFDGPVSLDVAGRTVALARAMAREVRIAPAENEAPANGGGGGCS